MCFPVTTGGLGNFWLDGSAEVHLNLVYESVLGTSGFDVAVGAPGDGVGVSNWRQGDHRRAEPTSCCPSTRALGQLETADVAAFSIVTNPTDWEELETLLDAEIRVSLELQSQRNLRVVDLTSA